MENIIVIQPIQLSIDIYQKLVSENRYFFWRHMAYQRSVERYKKFLLLASKYPRHKFVPTTDIDKCWHIHLQSPVAYYKDCMNLFGQILDHKAGFGRNPDEKVEWKFAFLETARLWQDEFKESYTFGSGMPKVCSSCSSTRYSE